MMERDSVFPFKEGDVVRQYVFHEIIGKGGFATIYRVHHKLFNQDFAAKVLIVENADKWETFQQEVEALKHLNHEHIIRLYDIFREGNVAVMILELCENGSLQKEIGNKGLSSERLISVTHQIVKALLYCHENNYPHCDLKPQNILLDRYGRVKLSDFGLTIFQDHKDAMVCKFKGTPLYTPPEIIRKIPHSKFLADIWSLGVMIAVMASGKHPWIANSFEQMKTEILQGAIVIPRKIPADIIQIIKRTVVVHQEDRISLNRILAFPIFQDIDNRSSAIRLVRPMALSLNNIKDKRRMSHQVTPSGEPKAIQSLVNIKNNAGKLIGLNNNLPPTVIKNNNFEDMKMSDSRMVGFNNINITEKEKLPTEICENNEVPFNTPLANLYQEELNQEPNSIELMPIARTKSTTMFVHKMLHSRMRLPITGTTGLTASHGPQKQIYKNVWDEKEQKVKENLLPLGRRFSTVNKARPILS